MKKITFFNHKGGVGKTTLSFNVARSLIGLGHNVLLVDADPQCNLTSMHLSEKTIDELLEESDDENIGNTIWSALRPVALGRGGLAEIQPYGDDDFDPLLIAGDVALSDYEEELHKAWPECFAGRTRGYDVTCALSKLVSTMADDFACDVVIYDIGPNVGALNRAVILDTDYFITPVAPDLFSLRALSTVGRAIEQWISDWKRVKSSASPSDKKTLLKGSPEFLGYVISAFKQFKKSDRSKANAHDYWEKKIASRVRMKIVDVLQPENISQAVQSRGQKLGEIKHYQSLAASAQRERVGIGELKTVNPGHRDAVRDAANSFEELAKEIVKRADLN